jgi:hypothetical protein
MPLSSAALSGTNTAHTTKASEVLPLTLPSVNEPRQILAISGSDGPLVYTITCKAGTPTNTKRKRRGEWQWLRVTSSTTFDHGRWMVLMRQGLCFVLSGHYWETQVLQKDFRHYNLVVAKESMVETALKLSQNAFASITVFSDMLQQVQAGPDELRNFLRTLEEGTEYVCADPPFPDVVGYLVEKESDTFVCFFSAQHVPLSS